MKFIELYKDLKYLEVDDGIIRGRKPVPCAICKEPTIFVDLCSKEPFCSEECFDYYFNNIWDGD